MSQPGLTPPSEPFEPYTPPAGVAAPEPYVVPARYLAPTGRETHGGALCSMVLGIIGVVSGVLVLPTSGISAIGMLCSPVALGLGIWSGRVIAREPHVYGNKGMATAGWILGLVGLVLALLMVLFVVAIVAFFIWVFSGAEPA
jgi:hypothetical protein